jgi:hypothetical protein
LNEVWKTFLPIHEAPNVDIADKRNAFLDILRGKAKERANYHAEARTEEGYKRMIAEVFQIFGAKDSEKQVLKDELKEARLHGSSYEDLRAYVLKINSILTALEYKGCDLDELVQPLWPRIEASISGNVWMAVRAIVPEFRGVVGSFTEQFWKEHPCDKFRAMKDFIVENAAHLKTMTEFQAAPAVAVMAAAPAANQRHEYVNTSDRRSKKKRRFSTECNGCASKEHGIGQCPVPTEQRREIIKASGACELCLRRDHTVEKCTRKFLCQRCYKYEDNNAKESLHHWWLCPRNSLGSPQKRMRRVEGKVLDSIKACVSNFKFEQSSDSDESTDYPSETENL